MLSTRGAAAVSPSMAILRGLAPDGGLYVSGINWDGNAENCGFREKDIVVAVDGKPVRSIADVKVIYELAMENIEKVTKAPIVVSRNGRKTTLLLDYTEDTEKED